MDRHNAAGLTRNSAARSITATLLGLLFLTCAAPFAAGQVPKVGRLDGAYKLDDRLMAVASKGRQTKRCVAASIGHFAILTNYHCLAEWWDRTREYSVTFASDAKRQEFYGHFQRAHRGGTGAGWALLETYGHSSGYFGFQDLDGVRDLEARDFDLVGFSSKVKGGREPAIQSRCRLTRAAPGLYSSECGADFDASGIIILHTNAAKQTYVNGLAMVQSKSKTGKQLVLTLTVASSSSYGATLRTLRQDQDKRYAAVVERQRAAEAEYRAANAGQDEADRVRREARRKADLEKLFTTMAQLGATLGNRGRAPAPVIPGSAVTGSSGEAHCPLTLRGPALYSQQTAVAPSGGGTIRVQIDTPAGCWWRFDLGSTVGGAWITTESPLSGTGPATLSFTATPHPADPSVSRLLYFTLSRPPRPGQPAYDRLGEFRVTQCTPDVSANWCGASSSTSQ